MNNQFHRVDYTICGINFPNTLKILPTTGHKSEQKFVIGDKNGVLQCLSIKDEEPHIQFKTLPGKSITSVQIASTNNDAHGDKIFAASGNEVKGYTRKGKVFLTIETSLTETITSMSVVGSDLILCSGRTITFYNDLQESHSYTCDDRVLDIAAFEISNSSKLRLLVLSANKGTAILENGKLISRITIPSGPSRLAVTPVNRTNVLSFYGANDGSIGIILYEQSKLSSKCLVEGRGLGSIVCLGWYQNNSSLHLAVGRHDGSVQLYMVDIETPDDKPRLKYTYFCGEPVTSVNGCSIGTENELLVASFSGRIFALRPGHQSNSAALSKLSQDALAARRAKLEVEIARLEKQTSNEREKYQRSTHSISSSISSPPLLDIQYEVLGAAEDGWQEVRLISAVPLDMLFIYSKSQLIMETDSAAVLCICPSQEKSNDILATVRCQAGTRRLWIRMRRGLDTTTNSIPGAVIVYIYALPVGAPRVARLITLRLPALAFYSQHADLDCEKQSRPWCVMRVSGSFSVAETTSWLIEALPQELPRPAASISFARSHVLVGTYLICQYQRGLAIFKSDNVSTIAVMKSIVSNYSMEKGLKIEINCEIPQYYLQNSLKLLENQLLLEYQKKKNIDLEKAITALDLNMSTQNDEEKVLCGDYMQILNSSSEDTPRVTHFEELTSTVVHWHYDCHILSMTGDNPNNKIEHIKAELKTCNIPEVLKIINKR